jgi:hypothetical protein
MEEGTTLWLARATPRAWLVQGARIAVRSAPTHFGTVSYEIVSEIDHGRIRARVELPTRQPLRSVLLRLRHPGTVRCRRVTVNGIPWPEFDPAAELIRLQGLPGTVAIEAKY